MTSMDISRTYNYARPSGTWRILCSFNTCVNSSFTASRLAAQRVAPSEPVDALNESLMLVVIFSICLVVYHALMCRRMWDQRWHCRNINTYITYLKMKQMLTIMTNDDWVSAVMECTSALGCTCGASFSCHLSIKNSNPCSIFLIDMSIPLSHVLPAYRVAEGWCGRDCGTDCISCFPLSQVSSTCMVTKGYGWSCGTEWIWCTLHSIQLEYKLLGAAIEDVS